MASCSRKALVSEIALLPRKPVEGAS